MKIIQKNAIDAIQEMGQRFRGVAPEEGSKIPESGPLCRAILRAQGDIENPGRTDGDRTPRKSTAQSWIMKIKKGFTITELLMGMALLGIITLVLVSIISNSMTGYNRGRVAAQARENARQAIDRISQDLRQGVPIPYQQNGRSVPSPVLFPDSYTETKKSNLIIFTQIADITNIDTSKLGSYRYIVYRVNQTQTNILERLIYSVDNGLGSPQGLTLDTTTGQWIVTPSLFAAPLKGDSAVVLPQSADTLGFTLAHQAVAANMSQIYDPDPGKVLLDPFFYTLDVTVKQYDPNELKKASSERNPITINLTSVVRIEGLSN